MATGPDLSSSSGAAAAAVPDAAPGAAAKKDRHIVSWSAEEDSVLRAQIALHGTDNWTIIAAQFKDKTARQCRRRWYNYLNSECKKGGWSREEDMLLCEAQKLLGNRWTEIAKVVSGRTDNAVKNRFSTLCKRRAKDDEPDTPCSNTNAKRVITQTGFVTPGAAGSSQPMKQMSFATRSCSSDLKENIIPNMRLFGQEKNTQQDARQPLATISSNNQQNVNTVKSQNLVATSTKPVLGPEQHCVKPKGNFMKKDDPKVAILLQQADLLCSLATKIKTEDTGQSMDEAWQQLQHHLVKKEDNGMSENSESGIASLLEELDDLIVDPYENEEEDEQKLREQNGQRQTDVENEGPSQASMEVTSNMAPDGMAEDHTVDNCKEVSSLCTNMLSGSMEACPGAKIPASESLSEVAEDSRLQCVESTSPVLTDIDDFIIDPYESKEEDELNSREQNVQIDVHGDQSYGPPSQGTMEITLDMTADELMEACLVDNCKEDNSLCRNVLSGSMEPCSGVEKAASENLSKVAEESKLQCMESTSPVLTNFQTKECGETPARESLNELADSRLQCVEFTSPAHTVLRAKAGDETFASPRIAVVTKDSKLPSMEFASPAHTVLRAKADAETFASPRITVVAKDSKLPSMEFNSPAQTVATFQPYTDNMPTPKFTASERNFLLSVLELTSPGSKPESSQQPSCKRALLNSL
ncbi:unnamed protein product [Urochloa decumbens]|uniref:Uncharacterized protein n=1 Tax=Urochloa decumbens TaxID=240449 RepID=A0ABC9G3B5_9POAL